MEFSIELVGIIFMSWLFGIVTWIIIRPIIHKKEAEKIKAKKPAKPEETLKEFSNAYFETRRILMLNSGDKSNVVHNLISDIVEYCEKQEGSVPLSYFRNLISAAKHFKTTRVR